MRNLMLHNNGLLSTFDELLRPVLTDAIADFKVHVVERQDDYQLSAELPGVEKSDINLDFTANGMLVIEVDKKVQKKEETDKVVYSEFKEFKSKRTFNFKNTVDPTKIKANFENGLLVISLGKLIKEDTKTTINID